MFAIWPHLHHSRLTGNVKGRNTFILQLASPPLIVVAIVQFAYTLQCQKCKYEYLEKEVLSPTASSICGDGVWFYCGGEMDAHGLYCCTGCIKWFQKYTRLQHQDAIKRVWRRFTRHDVCCYPVTEWLESEKRTMAFVSRFKEIEKRKEKNTKRKNKRKRKRKTTEIEIKDAPPLDVSKTIRAHEQAMKTLRNYITKWFLAPDTDPNQISAVVYSVVLGKLDVIQTLGDTLKEHI